MFVAEQKPKDLVDTYKDAINCYEQLQLRFNATHVGQPLDVKVIERCFNKIEELLNLELESQDQAESNTYICNSLILIQQQLMQLAEKPKKIGDSENTVEAGNAEVQEKRIEVTIPRVNGLSEVAGLDDIKKLLTTIIVLPIHQPQLYLNQKICNSVLLFGPPGTGKTRLAHAIASEASATFYSVNCSDILSYYVGNTEKAIKGLFYTLREEENCALLFIDEIDGLCQSRQSTESEWSRRLKTELMCQLSNLEDCPNKYLICATNCPWDLDTAIIRRFQRRIYVPLPNKEERMELIKYLTKDTTIEICPQIFSIILEKTEGYSCSDITDVIRNAINIPIHELSNTRLWEHIGNNQYKPAGVAQNIQDLVVCNVIQMPQGSIQNRPVDVFDIMKALEVVGRTVPTSDIVKYTEFLNAS